MPISISLTRKTT